MTARQRVRLLVGLLLVVYAVLVLTLEARP
jgi:hypothetical protein